MGVARRRRARGRWRVRASAGAVAHTGHGEDAVLADRLLLQGPRDPRRVLARDLAARRFRLSGQRRDAEARRRRCARRAARADRAGRGSPGFSLPVRTGFPRGDAACADQLHPDHSPSGLRPRALGAGFGRPCAGRSPSRQSAGAARVRAAACSRDGAWRLRLRSCADLFCRRHDAARARGRVGLARGIVLGRRSRPAIRLRRTDVDELVDPCAHEPGRRGGR